MSYSFHLLLIYHEPTVYQRQYQSILQPDQAFRDFSNNVWHTDDEICGVYKNYWREISES